MTTLRFRYQTLDFGDTEIHVRTLKNNQQFSDPNDIALKLGISSATWPLFGIIWESGEILARIMQSYDIEGKRILEVGCGIALASLVLNNRKADITATDYHPEVETFLQENTRLNNNRDIPFVRTDWNDKHSGLDTFDVIIGSDLLYERGHADQLAQFINRHAKKACKIIIIDPGRSQHGLFSKNMEALGYLYSHSKPENIEHLSRPITESNRFQVLQYQRH